MHQIDGDSHHNHTFRVEDAANNIPATQVTAEWLNAVQAELVALATASGAALDKNNNGQALVAVQALLQKNTIRCKRTSTLQSCKKTRYVANASQ